VDGILYDVAVTTLVAYPIGITNPTFTISPSTVTMVKGYAFYASITLSVAVTTIGNFAFASCAAITSFSVEVGNTSFTAVDGILYNASMTTLVAYPMGNPSTSYTISPSTVTTIGTAAFNGTIFASSSLNSLTSVTISSAVTHIGESAFQYCTNLAAVTFLEPSSTPILDANAFDSIASPSTAYYLQGANPASLGAPGTIFTNIVEIQYPCFNKGTKILTQNGYQEIETLQPGDRILTLRNG